MSAVLKLAEVLPQTKLQTLRCLPAKCSRSLLAPSNIALFLHSPTNLHFSCTRSMGSNKIGVEGGKAIAAVLKETQITNLKYAAFTPDSPPVSAPVRD